MKSVIYVAGSKCVERVVIHRRSGHFVRLCGHEFPVECRSFGWALVGYVGAVCPQFGSNLALVA